MATDKNIIKNWFRNGLKPTQEQFWAWIDSFYHKSDKIPQTQIEGLDGSLANKADVSQLNAKANTDASGLSAENIISWKEALGVRELPSNIATVDSGDVEGNVHTKEQIMGILNDITLEKAVNNENYTPRDILFRKESNDIKEIRFGTDISTASLYFGTFNKLSTGNYNVSYGIGALENNTTGETNTAIGGYALYSNRIGTRNIALGSQALQNFNPTETSLEFTSYNTVIGPAAGFNMIKGGRNTFIGDYAGSKLINSNSNTFIGQATGISLNAPSITIDKVNRITPVIGKSVFAQKTIGGSQSFGINPNDPDVNYKLNSGMNTFVGNILTSYNGPTSAFMSTIIGQSPLWNLTEDLFNTVIIGAGNYSSHRSSLTNSLIIGNNLNLNAPNGFKDNVLAIHNDKNNFITIDKSLVTGNFTDRWFRLNSRFEVNMDYMPNANGDDTYDKYLVYKNNGWIGYEDKPKIKRYILKNDIAINGLSENSTSDLVFTLEAGKLYRIKMCVKYKSPIPYSTIFFKLISYDLQKEINFCTDSDTNLIGINSGNTIYPSGINTHQDNSAESKIVEGMIKVDKTITVNNSLKLEGSHPSQMEVILEKGTYIELEEII
ncbi:hypothetical protein LEQ04_08405 [Riemerella anatipestifer]|uniref:hypothetical protein n=1 Tax=Riemerella anatipestifer TaxID=34085 RepID=UPI00129DC6CB|nr:hypothetical protein [Riemerella anatipestifer]MRM84501.1 hypothetical protein [Riemerella anatipestifer]WPC10727.1 hypothetical protein LEQ05_12795 [Riemerella anatipestifer]WPC13624.1 hypothetical protein LEQ03_02875 [Riemerella anatipestifer]WPC14601.1 hypothetical protein LEQ04_08405 [Riemerella anatipestifer]